MGRVAQLGLTIDQNVDVNTRPQPARLCGEHPLLAVLMDPSQGKPLWLDIVQVR